MQKPNGCSIMVGEENDTVFGLAFHPRPSAMSSSGDAAIMAAGLISGHVVCQKVLFKANDDCVSESTLFSKKYHRDSCRALDFSTDGSVLFTVGNDRSLQVLDTQSGRLILRKLDAHSESINTLKSLNAHVVVTGDDAGVVKLWDTRQRKMTMQYNENDDFISDFALLPNNGNIILASSADERLSVFDIRKKKPVKVSDRQEDELLCVTAVKNGKKAVVGTQDGVLSIFSYNNWGDCTDRLPGHPDAINTLVKVDEDRILTGSSDGLVRCIHILPNRLERVLEGHEDFLESIEGLKIVPPINAADESPSWVAGFAHDGFVRFWSLEEGRERGDGAGTLEVNDVKDDKGDDVDDIESEADESDTSNEDELEEDEKDEEYAVASTRSNLARNKKKRQNESDSDSDDSDNGNIQQREKGGKKKARRGIGGSRKTSFFSGLD